MLLVAWLTAPWRVAMSLMAGLASILSGRQLWLGLAIVVTAGLAVAVARALDQGQWMVGGVQAFVGLAAVLCPFLDAALSRRAELAADRFAADHGLALQLAAALSALDDGRCAASGWLRRLLASHPTPDRRISALLAAAPASPVPPPAESRRDLHSASGRPGRLMRQRRRPG
jgi:STE24 endopeptidase